MPMSVSQRNPETENPKPRGRYKLRQTIYQYSDQHYYALDRLLFAVILLATKVNHALVHCIAAI